MVGYASRSEASAIARILESITPTLSLREREYRLF